ncbi:MAG: hypothetical protein ABW252_23465 [Polyangiales bacterium]
MQKKKLGQRVLVASVCLLSTEACDGENTTTLDSDVQNIVVACPPPAGPPAGAWVCPAPLAVECGAPIPALYVTSDPAQTCAPETLRAEVPSAGVGRHDVTVRRADGSVACTTALTITDTAKPVLAGQTIALWPPNHKLHTIAVEDCVHVADACAPTLTGEFIWASSDEPINGRGDGNKEPDVVFDDCGHVQVRAERAGPKDGRVYRFGVRVVDAAGNASESACTVVVDHAKNGTVAADSGDAYRVALDGTGGTLACDGVVPVPTPAAPAPTPVTTPDRSDGTVAI